MRVRIAGGAGMPVLPGKSDVLIDGGESDWLIHSGRV